MSVMAKAEENRRKQECFDRCLVNLSPDERELLLRYYEPGDSKISGRNFLAAELGISATLLRIRIRGVRNNLERCIADCMKVSSTSIQKNK
jgi:DNA-directed RNA polymerase specialized sigma24 family protein